MENKDKTLNEIEERKKLKKFVVGRLLVSTILLTNVILTLNKQFSTSIHKHMVNAKLSLMIVYIGIAIFNVFRFKSKNDILLIELIILEWALSLVLVAGILFRF